MGKTEIRTLRQGRSQEFARMLQDLNGRRPPHGLLQFLRESWGHQVAGIDGEPWAAFYLEQLRRFTDLWLATGRREGFERQATRKPTPEISLIVETVVTANKVLPVVLRDGYSMTLATVPRLLATRRRLEPSTAGAKGKLLSAGHTVALGAAEKLFVTMLMSDWRLKVARCATVECGVYFGLGKWNQSYEQGTRCADCQARVKRVAIQRRVEADRESARHVLHAFVAARFARRIVPRTFWYRDAALKKEIARVASEYISREPLLRSVYPQGVTAKWVESGHQGKKNWRLIELGGEKQ